MVATRGIATAKVRPDPAIIVPGLSPGWRAVAAAGFGLILGPSVVLIMCFGIFLPALHASFGWPIERISFGAAIISAVIMLLSPVQGMLVDRYGPRRMVLAFLVPWGVALIAMSRLPASLPVFYAACVLLPLAALGLWPLAYLKIATTWFDRHLGIALGVTNLGPGLGAAVMPALLGVLFVWGGWRTAYLTLGIAVIAVWLPILWLALREGDVATVGNSGRVIGIGVREAARTRAFWIVVVNFFVLGAMSTGLLVHQVAILIDAGLAPGRAIAIQSAVGVASIVGRLGTGWLLDRVRTQWIGTATFALAAAACALLASDAAAPLAIVAAAIVGLVVGAEFDLLSMLIRRYQGVAAFGRLYGWVFAAFQLGAAIGAAAIGIGHVRFGSYAPPLLVLAALLLVCAALFALIGPYRYAPGAPKPEPAA